MEDPHPQCNIIIRHQSIIMIKYVYFYHTLPIFIIFRTLQYTRRISCKHRRIFLQALIFTINTSVDTTLDISHLLTLFHQKYQLM